MEVLISVAAKISEYTVAPVGRQLSYLIFYKRHFKNLADNVKDLEGTRDEISHLVEAERRNGREIETAVQNWLGRVDEVIQQANQLQEDPGHAKVGCSRWSCPNLMLRHQLSRKATKKAKDVDDVRAKGKFDRIGYLPPLEVVPGSAVRGMEKFESRKTIKEDIVKALTDPKASRIGVYGLGGVGKTTLVKEIAHKVEQDKLFDAVVLANVSKTPDLKTIQGEIADTLGLRFEEETVAGRALRLCQRIKKERTILIILDDIWTRLDLEKVGILSGDEPNDLEKKHYGCKVLMTSRNQDVLCEMEAQKDFTFRLQVLSEEETWSLFKVKAGDVDKEPGLPQIASEVAKKCGGLPVLIITVARSLVNQDIHAWRDASNQLAGVDNQEWQEITHSALELCYNHLKGSEMKALFLLCAAIGEWVSIDDLIKYGMGLGIFNDTNTVEGARNRFHIMIRRLKASCLLEDDTSTRVKMHDTIREVAISIASRDQHMLIKKGAELKEWPTKELLERCPQIFLKSCDIPKFLKRLECPNLKVFWFKSNYRSLKIPDSMFEGTGNLKVLDITRVELSSLPTSLSSLTNLKTLCLDHCVLEDIDAIGALKNLEILSLLNFSMMKLPSVVGNLTHLRLLDLSGSRIKVIPPNIISSLTKLEELYMGNTSIEWEAENSCKQNENASLAELRQLSNLAALELQICDAWIFPRDLMFDKLERYKIVIGDVWEWSDIEDTTLKTLKLKLGSNIHLEHGIKALIRRVENLYLDEVDGISNVLYQLNGVGFPELKHIHIQNNAKIKHIVDSIERNHSQVSFPNLETLSLQNLKNLEKLCHGSLAVNSFKKLRVIKVENCIQLKYLMSSSMVKGLSQLSEIEVCQCNAMKRIVSGDREASADNDITIDKIEFLSLRSLTLQHLHTLNNFFSHELTSSISEQRYQRSKTYIPVPFFSAQVAFPNLDTLKLSSLNFNKIWEDNQYSVHKLTNLVVENCGGLNYLFSSTTVGSFMNLKCLEISDCHLMEDIIATEERNNSTDTSKEARFPKLETIILKGMKNLKTIWYSQFETLKMLQVQNCEKIVMVFPSSIQKTYHNLEKLEVTDCALVEQIFEVTSNEKSNIEVITQLKRIYLHSLPKLKQIWSTDPQGILSFENLEYVYLDCCENLEYLFPLSVATCCSRLKELFIKYCGNMKEIVTQKEGSMCTTAIFEFNQLNTLLLWELHKLKGFHAGNHLLACPSLRRIDVSGCVKLNLFMTLSASNHGRFPDGKLHVSMQKPLFIVEEVIPNLEKLRISPKDATKILQAQNLGSLLNKMTFLGLCHYENEEGTFPDWFLQNVFTLEWLVVEWSSFKKIFQDERLVSEKIYTRVKRLQLNQLPELQHICEDGFQIDPVLEVLEYLEVYGCSSLINLVPSSVAFSHLTYLEIAKCNGMINLITSPTAKSLTELSIMKIKECDSLEEIIAEKGDETVCDIALLSLEILMLEYLPRLNKFCSNKCFLRFPLLKEVVVRQCPRMKIFSEGDTSTPNLRKVYIVENNKEWRWKENLNGTIKKMFEDKVAFSKWEHLSLSEYPELKDFWYGQLHLNMFYNLKSLVVQRCDFLSDVLFSSNVLQVLHGLEDLELRDCDSLEMVFDVKGMNPTEMLLKQSSQLKNLTLSRLPKMKHIWSKDSHEIISFGNLCKVDVVECQSLVNLFPLSLCQDLQHLEKLNIESCGVSEIIAMDEELAEDSFNFPKLTCLRLIGLRNLQSFYPGRHTLECPSLEILNVLRCEALQMFAFDHSNLQQSQHAEEIQDMPVGQALFSIEMVSPNLKKLALNGKDTKMILNGHCPENLFHQVELLRLQYFDETPIIFLNDFLKIFPNLETLQVRYSSFKTLFPIEGIVHCSTGAPKQTRGLWLFQLEHLRHIWHEDSPLDQIAVQNLEDLYISNCPSLISLVPSSMTFKSLNELEVDNCKGLIYLMTSSTAKSLMQLTTLKIKNCEMIKDVIKTDEEEAEEEIIFENLEYLEFSSLSTLRSFCYGKPTFIFPSLVRFIVKGCSQMKIFSLGVIVVPFLTVIEVENQKKRWKGDVNTSIEQLFIDKKEVSHSNEN